MRGAAIIGRRRNLAPVDLEQVVTDLDRLGTTTLTFDDWGVDVSVEVPPSDQVMTMPGAPSA